MGLALASCDDSYDDWSQPQQNPQEEIITLPNFTATVAQPIDFDQVTSDSVTVFTLNEATLPEGVTLEKGRLEITAQNAAKTTVNVSGNGRACTAELLDHVGGRAEVSIERRKIMEHAISFPALGLDFSINRVAVNLFG